MSLMLKKNYLLKKRTCCATCCECLSPVIVMLLFSLIGVAIPSIYNYDSQLYFPAGMRDATPAAAHQAAVIPHS